MFNHIDFEITYHSGENEEWGTAFLNEGGRIVGAKLEIKSINHALAKDGQSVDCDINEPVELSKDMNDATIKYSYSVVYKVFFRLK